MMFSDCDSQPRAPLLSQEDQTSSYMDLLTQASYPTNYLADEIERLFIREPAATAAAAASNLPHAAAPSPSPRPLLSQRDRLCSDGSDGSFTSSDQSLASLASNPEVSPQQNLEELSEIIRVVGLRDAIAHLKQLARTSLNPLPVDGENFTQGLAHRRHSTSSAPSSIPPGFSPRDNERSVPAEPEWPDVGSSGRLSRWQALKLSAPMQNQPMMSLPHEVLEANTWPPTPDAEKWQAFRPVMTSGEDMMTKESLVVLLREQNIRHSSRHELICVFCRNNGESKVVYTSHRLKDATGCIMCPVLRAYTCPICSASGDNAHTLKYCPQSKDAGKAPMKSARKTSTKLALVKGQGCTLNM